jgi:hypothetical protein
MKSTHLISSLCVSAFLAVTAGCFSMGNAAIKQESEASIATKVVEGKTTMAEIKSLFGPPTNTSFTDSGLLIWTYDYAHMKMDAVTFIPLVNIFKGGGSGTKKQFVVLFDEKQIVKKYSLVETPLKSEGGLLTK